MTESPKQEFIGGVVATVLAKKGIDLVVERALKKVASAPSTRMTKADAEIATRVVVNEVNKEVEARVEHQTNNEPAYQSRVAQGSTAAIILAIGTIWQFWTDGVSQTPMDYTPPVLTIVAGAWALYGRFVAKKPFGR